jgi:hypothetical protein
MKIQCLLDESGVFNLFCSLQEFISNPNSSSKPLVLSLLMKIENKKLTPKDVYSDFYLLSLNEEEYEALVSMLSTSYQPPEKVTEMTLMIRRNLQRGLIDREESD